MNTATNCQKGDILINFRDMLRYILRRWKIIVIGALVLTVLAGGYKYWQDYRDYRAKVENSSHTVTLSDSEMANAKLVLDYQEAYSTQARYNAESLIMQLNPTAVPTYVTSYLIDGSQSYTTALLYQKTLATPEVYAEIAEAVGMTDKATYLSELISSTAERDTTAPQAAESRTVFAVKVVAPTKEMCQSIAKLLAARVQKIPAELADTAGKHTCVKIGETFNVVNDNTVKNAQQSNINNCSVLRNNLRTAREALTSAEKNYVASVNNTSGGQTVSRPSISKKFLVLGFGGGLVLFAAILALAYVFDKHLKSREDMEDHYGLYVFGTLTDDNAAMIGKQVALTARQNGYAAVCGVSALAGEKLAAFGSLKVSAAGGEMPFTICGDLLRDPEQLQKLADAQAAVLIEKIGVSLYGDIDRVQEMCARLGKPVLGVILTR